MYLFFTISSLQHLSEDHYTPVMFLKIICLNPFSGNLLVSHSDLHPVSIQGDRALPLPLNQSYRGIFLGCD